MVRQDVRQDFTQGRVVWWEANGDESIPVTAGTRKSNTKVLSCPDNLIRVVNQMWSFGSATSFVRQDTSKFSRVVCVTRGSQCFRTQNTYLTWFPVISDDWINPDIWWTTPDPSDITSRHNFQGITIVMDRSLSHRFWSRCRLNEKWRCPSTSKRVFFFGASLSWKRDGRDAQHTFWSKMSFQFKILWIKRKKNH
jgi:hypothetical protein